MISNGAPCDGRNLNKEGEGQAADKSVSITSERGWTNGYVYRKSYRVNGRLTMSPSL
jgi:hypothetical protein